MRTDVRIDGTFLDGFVAVSPDMWTRDQCMRAGVERWLRSGGGDDPADPVVRRGVVEMTNECITLHNNAVRRSANPSNPVLSPIRGVAAAQASQLRRHAGGRGGGTDW